MRVRNRVVVVLGAIVILGCGVARAAENMKVDELLQHHLDSVGPSQARAATKNRVVEGAAAYRVLMGGSGEILGKCVMASEGDKLQILMKINALKYHGEKFLKNGDRTFVAGTYDDGTRSEFGVFLRSEDLPLKGGILGGVWSTNWPLLDEKNKDRMHYEGLKKVEGTSLHAVSYRPKKNSDMDITLYFDPETFHHVLTVYKVSVHAGLAPADSSDQALPNDLSGGKDALSARQQQTRYRIEERFSDFRKYDDLTLPSRYNLRFSGEYQNGFTKTVEWDVTASRMLTNIQLDARNFDVP